MIAKCRAIAHGKTALEYIFRETKLKDKLLFHNLCGDTAGGIHEEMSLINGFNSRCRNKFLRIEIGIAPKDEPVMSRMKLRNLVWEFIQAMGLKEHQAVAVTHKDTDNLHIHIIANRMDMNGAVYDTTFVSNRAVRVAEELSRRYGLTVAKELTAEKRYRRRGTSRTREAVKERLCSIAYGLLEKHMRNGMNGYASFRYELNRQGVSIEQMKNKNGRTYGLKFHFEGQIFKASEVGREFGYHSLLKQFGLSFLSPHAEKSAVPVYNPKQPTQSIVEEHALAETIVSMTEGIASFAGGLPDFRVHGADYAETAFQHRIRNEAKRKKKRWRRM
ncbi:mobilization protein [Porphyromonas cangingivalis]|uniref:Mobilization protein n=1 Tax=Porphyromonas cangingivalis TaxID=36874 RepID=A0A0A2EXH4_PORCN|nr:relaxase/mobilization nuclease domain-containing protein [Porphyromonas cangingivalis]KGN80989.1 mobilization protein [Porphyromonas cangingivalis]